MAKSIFNGLYIPIQKKRFKWRIEKHEIFLYPHYKEGYASRHAWTWIEVMFSVTIVRSAVDSNSKSSSLIEVEIIFTENNYCVEKCPESDLCHCQISLFRQILRHHSSSAQVWHFISCGRLEWGKCWYRYHKIVTLYVLQMKFVTNTHNSLTYCNAIQLE